MENYLLVFIASLFLVPWGLCLPHDHDKLEVRQNTPPTTVCPRTPITPDNPVWVSGDDAILNIQVNVQSETLVGYFWLVVEVDLGEAYPTSSSSGRLQSAGVNISPYYNAGITVLNKTNTTSDYQIWIDVANQTTPNYGNQGADYLFDGLAPRVEMQINHTTNGQWYQVGWTNAFQGATNVTLPDSELYYCGPGK